MPIRTNRGRAAVYRRLWGWPLRSPVHLLAFGLGIALIAVLIAILLPDSGGGARAEQQERSSAVVTPPTTTDAPGSSPSSTATTRLTAPLATPTSAPPAPQALQVAKQWATAWVNHPNGITTQQWLQGLAPYTTDEYLPVMSSVDPANVPSTKVTGEPSAKASYTSSAQILVPTDGGELELSLIRTPAGWRVAGYTKA